MNLSVLLDLKKAFDTVDHDVLLSKLSAYGVTDLAHGWFTSYLAGREQYFYVEGKSSNKRLVQCGIPQGSCLGPLLFIIYMNDFEKCLKNLNQICTRMTRAFIMPPWRSTSSLMR